MFTHAIPTCHGCALEQTIARCHRPAVTGRLLIAFVHRRSGRHGDANFGHWIVRVHVSRRIVHRWAANDNAANRMPPNKPVGMWTKEFVPSDHPQDVLTEASQRCGTASRQSAPGCRGQKEMVSPHVDMAVVFFKITWVYDLVSNSMRSNRKSKNNGPNQSCAATRHPKQSIQPAHQHPGACQTDDVRGYRRLAFQFR